MNASNHLKYIRIWLLSGIILVTCMVLIGGITRLTGSGLSIVEWRIVSGTLPPLSEDQWKEEFDKYKKSPEYKKINAGMNLQQFKNIFWWEYVHRLLGRLIGIVFLIPFGIFYFRKWLSKRLIKQLLFIFFLGGLQGLAGWLMVWSGLQDQPHVSHFRLAVHLVLALALVSIMLWVYLELGGGRMILRLSDRRLFYPVAIFIFLFIQIIVGALVAGLKAGFSYNNFPLMENTFFPPQAVMNSTPLLYNGVVLQFVHRWMGFVILFMTIRLCYITRSDTLVSPYTRMLLVLTTLQVLLGIITLLLRVLLLPAIAHQFIAFATFGMTVMVIFKLQQSNSVKPFASER